MANKYSTGITPAHHEQMMQSVEARAERREALLADLPPVDMNHPSWHERDRSPLKLSPLPIDEYFVSNMDERLNKRRLIVGNQFTKAVPSIEKPEHYQKYRFSGNEKNTRTETKPSEVIQAQLAELRQPEHMLDRLHQNVWTQWQLAGIHLAGVRKLKEAVHAGTEISTTVRNIGASALEDFGFSLIESRQYRRYHRGYQMARLMIDVAVAGVDDESVLRGQSPSLFFLVQQEQERRVAYFEGALLRYEQPEEEGWGGNRRTNAQNFDEIQNQNLIAEIEAS